MTDYLRAWGIRGETTGSVSQTPITYGWFPPALRKPRRVGPLTRRARRPTGARTTGDLR